MASRDTLRRIQRANAAASNQYFAAQNRANQVRSADPSIDDTMNFREVFYMETDKFGAKRRIYCTPAKPMRAIVRPGIAPLSEPDQISVHPDRPIEKPSVTAEPITGSPVNLTVGEISRMNPEDRAIAVRRVMAFEGAKSRMAPVPGRTLVQALERELDLQRSVIRRSAELARQGETSRVSKTQSKIDRKNGRPPAKIGGTASFRGVKTTRIEFVPEAEDGQIEVRRVSRSETGMLVINKARDINRSKK